MKFLYSVWAFNKNYEYIWDQEDISDGKSIAGGDDDDDNAKRYYTFTFDYLIKKIMAYCEEDTDQNIRIVADWKLESTENFLKSMLINR